MISNADNGSATDRYTKNDINEQLVDSIVSSIKNIFIELGTEIVQSAGKSDFVIKKDGTPATKVDGIIEEKIIKSLSGSFPNLYVFGEESGYSDNLTEVCVLIDPIDGTKSFIKGLPNFTSMAVLIVENEALASVIYNPSSKKMFTAIKNKGAFLNDKKLDLIAKELPEKILTKKRHIEFLNEILESKNIGSETAPSGGGDGFSRVAEGLSAARFQINAGGHIHDYAPGALLVREAGGKIISLDKEKFSIRSKSFIACHPDLEKIFIEKLSELTSYTEKLRNKV